MEYQAKRVRTSIRSIKDPLLVMILLTAIVLAFVTLAGYQLWGTGQIIGETPWYIPMMHSFTGLAAFSVAFLALGRYPVLRDPASYWVGISFGAFGILSLFYILSWPGLLPNGRAVIASLPNTSAWFAALELTTLGITLLASVLARWPGDKALAGHRWLGSAAAWFLAVTLVSILSVVYEPFLPRFVGNQGHLTTLLITVDWVFLFLLVIGAILSTRRYQMEGEPLFGYVSIAQIAVAFVVLTAIIGAKRYDIWYYLSRIMLAGGFLTLMFGLLAEHVQLFRRVQESEARYRHLTEYLPQLIWTATPDGQCNYLSPQWIAYTGLAEAQQLGLSWLEQVHPEDRERVMESWKASVASGEIYMIDFRIRRNDGAYHWFKAIALPIRNMQGQIDQWFGSCTDIEDQKQAEAQLVAYNTRLERSNQDLQDFAFVASHDLQEPLRKIEYFGDLISRQTENLTPPQKEHFKRLTSSASRMRGMVNGLLQVSRLETQARPFQTVRLQSILNEVISDLERQIRSSNGKVEVCDLPTIEADPTQMRQLFQNLITNSLKFQPPGGKPHVKICYSQITPETVQIQVEDNGIGFDEAHADHLFEPFKRLVGKSEYEGSGIGLALCRKIVERHGGKITAHSQPGQGATFLMDLPMKQAGFIGPFMEGSDDGKPITVTGSRRRSG